MDKHFYLIVGSAAAAALITSIVAAAHTESETATTFFYIFCGLCGLMTTYALLNDNDRINKENE
jgi:uncharacterized membrane protein YuzA (DUF378 family)